MCYGHAILQVIGGGYNTFYSTGGLPVLIRRVAVTAVYIIQFQRSTVAEAEGGYKNFQISLHLILITTRVISSS